MEMRKWSREIERVLLDVGFEKVARTRTSHVKYKYVGPKTSKKVVAIVPSQIKDGSKAAALSTIKRALRQAGAELTMIERFDNIALGYMTEDQDNEVSELEEALGKLIRNQADIEIAHAAIALAQTAAKAGELQYQSKALAKSQSEVSEAIQRRNIALEIEKIVLSRVMKAVELHIDRHGYFDLGYYLSHGGISQLDDDVSEYYGVFLRNYEQRDSDYIIIYGHLVAGLYDCLPNKQRIEFSVSLFLSENNGTSILTDANDIETIHMYIENVFSLAELEIALDKFNQVKMLAALQEDNDMPDTEQ
jgi:predicted RNA binding protein YcfA (HicA-like mRNA interferase family)